MHTYTYTYTYIGSMEIIHNRSLYSDKQLIRLQETPDEVPEGETPFTVSLFAYDDLVDTVRPGLFICKYMYIHIYIYIYV